MVLSVKDEPSLIGCRDRPACVCSHVASSACMMHDAHKQVKQPVHACSGWQASSSGHLNKYISDVTMPACGQVLSQTEVTRPCKHGADMTHADADVVVSLLRNPLSWLGHEHSGNVAAANIGACVCIDVAMHTSFCIKLPCTFAPPIGPYVLVPVFWLALEHVRVDATKSLPHCFCTQP